VNARPRKLVTRLGDVTIRRAYYHCPTCRAAAHPYDGQIGLGGENLSAAMAESVTLLAVHHPFRQAERLLKQLTGRRVPFKTIHRLTGRVGGEAAAQERVAAEATASARPPAAELQPACLHVSTDGLLVRFRKEGFKEVKLATCYGDDERGRPLRRQVARTEPIEVFKWHAGALAARCGLEQAEKTALVADGAAWIWEQVAATLREDTTHIVDWYHAVEHLWACAHALYGEGTPASQAWVRRIKDLLYDGEVRGILRRLQHLRVLARDETHREALRTLIVYLTNQDDRLAYDRFRAAGFDIGSGQVESTCKQMAQRLKGPGMQWSPRGAQAVLSLRTNWLSNTWTAWWSQRRKTA
jgi:hypothetical protein